MKAIMIMFDSLNRQMLPSYEGKHTVAPNFQRLTQKSVIFDQCCAGSLPCMPAKRELHTGRYNFPHKSWGPLEPYDDSMPSLLKAADIYTHLTTDHWHYWEEGKENYLNQYNSYKFVRGQEDDPFKGMVEWTMPEHIGGRKSFCGRQKYINRYYIQEEENQPIVQNFSDGLDFIRNNYQADRRYLQLEAFGPHEPFFSPEKYKKSYEDSYDGPMFDWPRYHEITETPEQARHYVDEYQALLTIYDTYLGEILDIMDKYNIWKDTMLIVNTDYEFLLTQHNWWGEVIMSYYDETAHVLLSIRNPRTRVAGERRQSLVQTIDITPTILEFFGQPIPKDMEGRPLRKTLEMDAKIRNYALFGQHGVHINITDGRYVYMRCPLPERKQELSNYVVGPTGCPGAITVDELKTTELHQGFRFTESYPVLKTRGGYDIKTLGFPPKSLMKYGTLLFDLREGPHQNHPLEHPETEHRMIWEMIHMMKENDAPEKQYQRLGLQVWLLLTLVV